MSKTICEDLIKIKRSSACSLHPDTSLFPEEDIFKQIPRTQYLGSKQKLVRWILEHLPPCNSILDAFSGSGIVGYELKRIGKRVVCNDFLTSSYYYAEAFVENNRITLTEDDINFLMSPNHHREDYIERHFTDVFYTREECQFLDNLHANILELKNEYKRDIAYASAVRTCIQKIPGGKFRSNLLKYRDKEFPHYRPKFIKKIEKTFLYFLKGYNDAVFDNGQKNEAHNEGIFDLLPKVNVDVVYFDPPYGGSGFDYERDYFFVELFTNYYGQIETFNGKTKTYPVFKESGFNKKSQLRNSFLKLFERASHIPVWMISYNNRSIPSYDEFIGLIKKFKSRIEHYEKNYAYKTGNNEALKEYLFVCR